MPGLQPGPVPVAQAQPAGPREPAPQGPGDGARQIPSEQAQAAASDLKAKRLLFDVLMKLQRANICHPADRLPEIRLDDSDGDANAEVAADIERRAQAMHQAGAGQGQLPVKRLGE